MPSEPVLRMMRRDRPVTSATMSVPKRCTIWSRCAMHGRQRGQLLDQPIPPFDGIAALHRLAVAKNGPRAEIALAIGERLEKLGGERVRQIIQNVLARRDVDLDVAPFLGRDFGKPALHQCFAGRDDLDDGGMAGHQVAIHRFD